MQRCVVVISSGWVFAGNVEDVNGRIRIHDAINVRQWSSVGFDGMLENPKSNSVILKPLPPGANTVDLPAGAEIYRVPVPTNWGI